MATEPIVRLGRVYLTERHLKALEAALYRVADMRDRLLIDGAPYTKIETTEVPNGG